MSNLKILSVFGLPVRIGGHLKSGLAHSKCLREMGHEVWVMAPGGAPEMLQEVAAVGLRVCDTWRGPVVGRLPSVEGADELIELGGREGVDLLHAHDTWALGACFAAAIRLQKGLVYTKAGGPVNDAIPPRCVETVFFSEELRDGTAGVCPLNHERVSIIRARIDRSVYRPAEVTGAFMQNYNLPAAGQKVVMAIRLDEPKRPWLDGLMRFAEQIRDTQTGLRVVLAGEGPLLDELRRRASDINKRCEGGATVHLIGPVFEMQELNQLYNYADVVVGHGRGILEAMACGKAVVILGEAGQGAVVGADNVERIAYFNFSGRHFRDQQLGGEDLPPLLRGLLADERRLAEAGRFAYEYIREHMAAEIGARELLAVYQRALVQRHSRVDYFRWYLAQGKTRATRGCRRRLASAWGALRRGGQRPSGTVRPR